MAKKQAKKRQRDRDKQAEKYAAVKAELPHKTLGDRPRSICNLCEKPLLTKLDGELRKHKCVKVGRKVGCARWAGYAETDDWGNLHLGLHGNNTTGVPRMVEWE